MALEKRDLTQIVSFEPPLPFRLFPITSHGSTSNVDDWGGSGSDGRLYGKFSLDTTLWTSPAQQASNPVVVGERIQVWSNTDTTRNQFPRQSNVTRYSTGTTASPDLFDFYALPSNGITPKVNAATCTVVGAVQTSANAWDVYYFPFIDNVTIDTQQDGIITLPDPRNGVHMGTLGHVKSLAYNWSKPGGPTSMSWTLLKPASYRHPAMDPGRVIQAFRGGSCIWEGINQEPQPGGDTGWTMTANGAGTYGSVFTAVYSKTTATTWNPDDVVNHAIGRGMRWKNNGIGKPTGIYLGQLQDEGSIAVTDLLNLFCTGGSLYWSVEQPKGARVPADPWEIKLRPFPSDINGLPTAGTTAANLQYSDSSWVRVDLRKSMTRFPPDLYIINVNPIPRTITNDYNTLVIKYMAKPDTTATSTVSASAAVYDTIIVDNPQSVLAHGRNEYYLDVSASSGMTEAQVVAIGQNILKNYVRANFAQAIAVQPGRLVNNGGVPVDLGVDWSGYMVSLLVDTAAFGGEVNYGTQTFMIGDYAFDDDTQTATITPYGSQLTDISTVINQLYPSKFA